MKNIAILGSTGSIGKNAVAVARDLPGFRIVGLTGHSQLPLLRQQASEIRPDFVVVADVQQEAAFSAFQLDNCQVTYGQQAVNDLASHPSAEIVVAAIVGIAGLESTWQAIAQGKRVALANKEALVVAGGQIRDLAVKTGAQIIPVDSEHSAIFQCLQAGRYDEVAQIILTASGGPFREVDSRHLNLVTVEQALDHPTWDMGPKITIDSATMMNKAFEIVEASWLFNVRPDQISVVIHPQSVVHSMVEFVDGALVAQMGQPDMRLPIQYALTYPVRVAGNAPRMNWEQKRTLEFYPADGDQFPALQLGYEVARHGGTTGAVLNAANEAAVAAFLNREISFTDIVPACREILENHHFAPHPDLQELTAQDLWAREEIKKWIAC